MVTYLGKFVKNLSKITASLRLLLSKDAEWSIQKPQLGAINTLKVILTTAPVLQFYNPSLPTRVSCDASCHGLRAILEEQDTEENWRPVAYASQSLAPAEYNYAPIEKATLGIVFSCERFNSYVYEKSFTVVNDHQLLKAIFSRSITECPPRIQRFMLHLQKYDFDIEYVSGKKMFVSDVLSRAHETDATSEIPELEMQHYSMYTQLFQTYLSARDIGNNFSQRLEKIQYQRT